MSQQPHDQGQSQQQQQSQQQEEAQLDKIVWTPIESDPEVFQDVVGLYGVKDTLINEVIAEELFCMLPEPVEALMVLFPCDHQPLQDYLAGFPVDTTHQDIFHIPQRISNACGTYALMHTFINLRQGDDLVEGSPLQEIWYQLASDPLASPDDKFNFVLKSAKIATLHHQYAQEGQTDSSSYNDTNVHYVTMFQKHGSLWMLDGAKAGPLNCGPCEPEEVLAKGYAIAKTMYMTWGKETDFAILAASKSD